MEVLNQALDALKTINWTKEFFFFIIWFWLIYRYKVKKDFLNQYQIRKNHIAWDKCIRIITYIYAFYEDLYEEIKKSQVQNINSETLGYLEFHTYLVEGLSDLMGEFTGVNKESAKLIVETVRNNFIEEKGLSKEYSEEELKEKPRKPVDIDELASLIEIRTAELTGTNLWKQKLNKLKIKALLISLPLYILFRLGLEGFLIDYFLNTIGEVVQFIIDFL